MYFCLLHPIHFEFHPTPIPPGSVDTVILPRQTPHHGRQYMEECHVTQYCQYLYRISDWSGRLWRPWLNMWTWLDYLLAGWVQSWRKARELYHPEALGSRQVICSKKSCRSWDQLLEWNCLRCAQTLKIKSFLIQTRIKHATHWTRWGVYIMCSENRSCHWL